MAKQGNVSVEQLSTLIANGKNILLSGKHGVGKTFMLAQACELANLKMKKFSGRTMDAYVDLVGVPVNTSDDDGAFLEMVRQRYLDEFDVIMIDELNRSEPKTEDGVMELIQFKEINGEATNIRSIVAGVNPAGEGYAVRDLEDTTLDRFDYFFEISPDYDLDYLTETLENQYVAAALCSWQTQFGSNGYLSPRRMEMIGREAIMLGSADMVSSMIHDSWGITNITLLEDMLNAALSEEKADTTKASSGFDQGRLNRSKSRRKKRVVSNMEQ